MHIHLAKSLTIAFAAVSASAFCELKIEWGKPFSLGAGGYARIHRLSDGRYMLAYGRGADPVGSRCVAPGGVE